jgi:hypothetical protein
MALNGIPISEDQCIGDSLFVINDAFLSLDTSLSMLSSALGSYASSALLSGLSAYATNDSLSAYTTRQMLSSTLLSYARTSSLSAYATNIRVDSLSAFAEFNFATNARVTGLSSFADAKFIPNPGSTTSGYVLTWNGANWIAAPVSTGTINLTGDVTSIGASTTYNRVVPSNKGGAGTISGIMKANGSGTVSAAVAGTDYVIPSTLGSYATTASLANYATVGSLSNYATNASLANKIDKPTTALVSGYVLTWNGSTWISAPVSTNTINLLGDITSVGANTTYNNVVPATKGGAGTVNGILKANGSGTVSAAVAGTDYVIPSALGSYATTASLANKIDKPTVVSGGHVLTYNGSTSTWVASAIPIIDNNVDNTPIGTVIGFAATTAPTGYLECNGAAVAVSQYSDLTTAIYCGDSRNNTAGFGYRCTNASAPSTSRSTTGQFIVLPDLRGEFIRGWDNGRGINAGRVFGSNEADEFESHTHLIATNVNASVSPTSDNYLTSLTNNETGLLPNENFEYELNATTTVPNILKTGSSGNTETRPRNVALLPCIKAWKTVTGSVQSLNFIEKPASATGGHVLTYNGSTNTWVASAAPTAPSNFIEKPASATGGQVLTYNGTTSTWVASAAPNSSLSIAGTVVVLQDQKPPNTGGGVSLANTWQKRVLNTKVTDVGNLCILSNSQFTLVAGTYLINASAPCFKGDSHQIRLYNVTDSSIVCLGTTEFTWNGSTNANQTRSHIDNLVIITATKTFELQHYIQTNSSDGLGNGFGLGTEIFSTVQLIKLG